MRRPRILVIDDGETYARVIAERMPEFQLLDPGGAGGVGRLPDGPSALAFLEERRGEVDVALLDMCFEAPPERLFPLDDKASPRRTRRFQGLAILREIRARYPDLPVVLLTSKEDLSLGEVGGDLKPTSMTYLLDGDDLDSLRIRIFAAWREVSEQADDADVVWGDDPAMRAVRRRLSVLARGRMPVILEGETGTGKSFLAERYLHRLSGRNGPFVVLDLAAVPRDLIPAHLFGAVRGAYTGAVADRKGVFEMAHGGTLFIDEVQNIPLGVQKQLLNVLQDRRLRPLGSARDVEVDVKLVAASNTPIDEAVARGAFRSDLYMRLSPATRVRLPPLRERRGDIELLARRFAERAVRDPDVAAVCEMVAAAVGLAPDAEVRLVTGRRARRAGRDGLDLALPEPARRLLLEHGWPGNTRELCSVVQNAVTFTLVAAADALRDGVRLTAPRLQIDPGLVSELLAGSTKLSEAAEQAGSSPDAPSGELRTVRVAAGRSLNAVSGAVERQYFLALFKEQGGDFGKMAERLLGDARKSRAVRLRFNQLGLKVREIEK